MANYRRQQNDLEDEDDETHTTGKIQTLARWEKIAYHSVTHFFVLLVLCAIVGLGLPILWNHLWQPDHKIVIESDLRYDCYPLRPLGGVSSKHCPRDSCVWDELAENDEIACYYGMERDDWLRHTSNNNTHLGVFPRYAIDKIDTAQDGDIEALLSVLKKPSILDRAENVDLTVETYLSVSVSHLSPTHTRVVVKPVHEAADLWSRYVSFNLNRSSHFSNASDSLGVVTLASDSNSKLFQLKVYRKGCKEAFFNMGEHSPFVFTKGWREMTTSLHNDLLYGLGQSNLESFKHNFSLPQRWFLYNQHPAWIDENTTNLFGSHPFYLEIEDTKTGSAHGVLLLNTFPIEVTTNARPSLTLRPLGGHFDLHFFFGPSASDVVSQLQEVIHRPALPPYWALGFHVCSRHCHPPTQTKLEELQEQNIPVESDCASSEKLGAYEKQKTFDDFKSKLGNNGRFVSVEWPQQFKSSASSVEWQNLSLTTHTGSELYTGTLSKCNLNQQQQNDWTLKDRYYEVLYPDFFNSAAGVKYADTSVTSLIRNADGFILDHNTPTEAWNDPRRIETEASRPDALDPTVACRDMSERMPWDYLLFSELNLYTTCLDAAFSQPVASDSEALLGPFLSLHNVYGYKHAQAVADIKSASKRRTLLLSLSTFIGSGQFGGHFGSTLPAGWSQLRSTLKQTLDFSLFGIPLAGFPVGGYDSLETDVDDELLQRWYQLAAVQPFMMSHTASGYDGPINYKVIKGAIQSAVNNRYRLLPYMYTLFYRAHTYGELVSRPVFFEFPTDEQTYALQAQYMLGPSLLVTPALEKDSDNIRAYFPQGRWYDIYSGQLTSKKKGGFIDNLSALDQLNLYLRGGHVIVTHAEPNLTVADMRRSQPFRVIGGLNESNQAEGELYLDDGEATLEERPENAWVRFKVESTNITIETIDARFCDYNKANSKVKTSIQQITIYGIIDRPHDDEIICHKMIDGGIKDESTKLNMSYASNYGVLTIDADLDFCDSLGYFISWSYMIW